MAAMSERAFIAMNNNLVTLHERQVNLIPFDMTHDECLSLVAPSDHVSVLKDASKYAHVSASQNWMELKIPAEVDNCTDVEVYLLMRTHAQVEPPLMPRHPQWQAGQSGEKVIAYMSRRLALSRQFGLAKWVLYQLNSLCDTGAQMRNIWPSVMHLCEQRPNMQYGEQLETWAHKHANFKACKTLPALSPQLKQAVRETAGVLTVAALVGKDVPDRVPGAVDIMSSTMPQFVFNGVTINRM